MTNRKCSNAEPGTFNHECGKPAQWLGGKPAQFPDMADSRGLFWAAFCDKCKKHGHEARRITEWLDIQ